MTGIPPQWEQYLQSYVLPISCKVEVLEAKCAYLMQKVADLEKELAILCGQGQAAAACFPIDVLLIDDEVADTLPIVCDDRTMADSKHSARDQVAKDFQCTLTFN